MLERLVRLSVILVLSILLAFGAIWAADRFDLSRMSLTAVVLVGLAAVIAIGTVAARAFATRKTN